MADKVELDFVAKGTIFDDLARMADGVDALGATHKKVQDGIQADLQETSKDAQELGRSFTEAGKLVVALAKSAGAGFPALLKNLKDVEDVTKRVNGALSQKDVSNFTAANAALRDVAKNQGVILKGVKDETKARIDALVQAGKLPAEQGKLLLETQEVVEALKEAGLASEELVLPIEESAEAAGKIGDKTREAIEETKTLSQQYRAAAENARKIGQQFGPTSPEFKKAAAEAARLKKVIDDTGASIKALNPGDKIAPFTSLANAVNGGAQAVSGLVFAFSDGDQELQKFLFKFQSALFAIQGAQSFLKDFEDALNNVKLALGLTTTTQEAAAAATAAGAVASEEAAVASGVEAAAKEANTAATAQETAGVAASIVAKEAQAVATGAVATASEAAAIAKGEEAAANAANVAATEAGVIANTEAAVATGASAVASEADAIAKGTQTAATVTATTATGGLVTALRTLAAALLANPFTAIAVALVAVIGLMAAFSDEAENATARVDALLNRIRLFREETERIRRFRDELDTIEAQLQEIGANDAPERQREIAIAVQQRQLERLNEDLSKARADQAAIQRELEALDPEADNFVENRDRLREALTETVEMISNAGAERVLIEARTQLQLKQIQQKAMEEAIARNRATLDMEETLAKQIYDIERELTEKISALEIEQADPRDRLRLEQEASDLSIANTERELRRTAALAEELKRIKIDAFSKLTELEKQRRADEIIAAGGGKLTLDQEKALNALRLLNERQFGNAMADLMQEEAKARLDLLVAGAQKENAEFEFSLQDRIEALRKANATELEIEAFADRERAKFRLDKAVEEIELDTQIQEAIINGRERGAEKEKEFERQKQLDLLAVRIEGAQAQLNLIKEDGTKETQLRRETLKAAIADMRQAQATLKADVPQFDILDLFGVQEEDKERVRAAIADIFSSAQSILASSLATQQIEVDAHIAATDQIIEDQQRRQDELRGLISEAEDENEAGRANDLNALRAQLAESKRIEAEEIANKKRLQAEKRKIAKDQIVLDGLSQASSLATSATNLIATWSTLPFGIGLISAFAQIALIASTFTSIRGKLKAAAAEDAPSLRHGGKLKGARHDVDGYGGIALLDRRNGDHIAWAEDGEHVTNREASKRHDPLLTAINSNNIGKVHQAAEDELRKAGKVVLSEKAVKKATTIMRQHDRKVPDNDERFVEVITELRGLREEVAGFKKQERDKPRTEGNATVTGNRKVISR